MPSMNNFQRFASSAGLVVGYRATGVVLGLFAQLILARSLPASDMGTFFMVTSMAAILGLSSTLGYPMVVPKHVLKSEQVSNSFPALNILRRARFEIVGIALGFIAIAWLFLVLEDELEWGMNLNIFMGTLCILPFAMLRFNGSIANAKKRFTLGFFPDLTVRPALLAIFLGILWMADQPISLTATLVAFATFAFITAGIQQIMLHKMEKNTNPVQPPENKRVEPQSKHRLDALSMLIGMLFMAAAADLAILFTSWFVSASELAIFGVCLKISMICGFAVNAVQQVAVRDLGDALSGQGHRTVNQVINMTNGASTIFALVSLVGVLVLGNQILSIFGPQYVDGYWCLAALMSVNLLRALAGPSLQLISLVNEERVSPSVFLFTLFCLLVLLSFLAPSYGLLGASLAFWVAMTIWPFWLSFVVWRKSGVSPISTSL